MLLMVTADEIAFVETLNSGVGADYMYLQYTCKQTIVHCIEHRLMKFKRAYVVITTSIDLECYKHCI